jgi:hypothetical protein
VCHGPPVAWLDDDDLGRFADAGYLLVRGVVSEDLLALADDEVDRLIRTTAPEDGDASRPGAHGWFRPSGQLPRCDDLLRLSPAFDIAQELVGALRLDHAFEHIQVATTVAGWSHIPGGPHIDGHGPGQDPPQSFTLLVGILLSDQHEAQGGNLWLWPGSHLQHQELFRQRGPRVLLETGGHPTLLDAPLALNPPVELRGGRGDLLLSHFLTGHNMGGNEVGQLRRTVYYRVSVPGHAQRWEETFLDPWVEYPPVQRVVAAGR